AVVDALPTVISDDAELQSKLEMPVIGYSLAYPIGVLGVIASIAIMAKVFRVNHEQEALAAGVAALPLHTRRVKVTKAGLPSVTDMPVVFGLDIIVARIEHKGRLFIAAEGDTVDVGDVVSVVGTEEDIAGAEGHIGELLEGDPTQD